jgi:hypothetical protein
MAVEVHQYAVTIPAGTAKTSPLTTPIGYANRVVDTIEAEVPPGPTGKMGFYLAVSGQQILPFESGQWIVWDNRHDSWDLTSLPTTGAWSLVGYNTGIWPHTVTVRFLVDLLPTPPSETAEPTFTTSETASNVTEIDVTGVSLS